MRILVTDGMDKTAMAQLREAGHEVVEQFYAPEELGAALREFDAVVVRSKTKVRANHIDEAKGGKLKLIIRGGVGVDNIDVKYAEANGITVQEHPDGFLPVRRGAGAWAICSPAHAIFPSRATPCARASGKRRPTARASSCGGKTLGIVGFGRIGQASGRHGQGHRHDTSSPLISSTSAGIEEQLGMPYVEMDELLAKSDFISVHAPAVDGGALINAERIAKMKDGVVHHQYLPRHQRRRGRSAGRARIRQGPRRRSGRLR